MSVSTPASRVGLLLPAATLAFSLIALTFMVATGAAGFMSQASEPAGNVLAIEAPSESKDGPLAAAPSINEEAAMPQQPQFHFVVPRRSPIQPAVYFEPFVADEEQVSIWRI